MQEKNAIDPESMTFEQQMAYAIEQSQQDQHFRLPKQPHYPAHPHFPEPSAPMLTTPAQDLNMALNTLQIIAEVRQLKFEDFKGRFSLYLTEIINNQSTDLVERILELNVRKLKAEFDSLNSDDRAKLPVLSEGELSARQQILNFIFFVQVVQYQVNSSAKSVSGKRKLDQMQTEESSSLQAQLKNFLGTSVTSYINTLADQLTIPTFTPLKDAPENRGNPENLSLNQTNKENRENKNTQKLQNS